MTIGIIGDLHLGASLRAGSRNPVTGLYSRLEDYYNTLTYTIKDIAKTSKHLVFTGDIFEHRYPTMLQQKLFSQAVRKALDCGIEKVHVIVGNHDQQRTSNTTTLAYLKELNLENIIVYEEMASLMIDDCAVYFMPYRDRKWFGAVEYSEAVAQIDADLNKLRDSMEGLAKKHVVVGHMALEGTFYAEEETELYTDNELMLPKAMFKRFDLTIMGHVHAPAQISSNPPIYYVGSMEKRGAFEKHSKKYALFDSDGNLEFRDEPTRNFYEYNIEIVDPVAGRLTSEIIGRLDSMMDPVEVNANIIKCNFKIPADDVGYFDAVPIYEHIGKYAPSFIFPISPQFISTRILKKESIESTSDTESWSNYIKTNIENPELAKRLISAGVEIISEIASEKA